MSINRAAVGSFCCAPRTFKSQGNSGRLVGMRWRHVRCGVLSHSVCAAARSGLDLARHLEEKLPRTNSVSLRLKLALLIGSSPNSALDPVTSTR